jgi:hypothetical protein
MVKFINCVYKKFFQSRKSRTSWTVLTMQTWTPKRGIVLSTTMLPIIRIAIKILYRPNHDHVSFNGVVNAIRKTLDEVTPDIVFDHAPHGRPVKNDSDASFDFIDKGVTQSRDLPVVIPTSRDELGQRFVNKTMPQFRGAARTSLRASTPSTRLAAPERTAERRWLISSK